MLDDFMIRAGLVALGVAMAAGVLGCFVVWRRMAYFGDATAHVAVLGVAMALMFGWSIFAGVGLVALTMAVLIYGLTGRGQAVDTILGVLSYGALATGLVAVTLIPGQRVELDAYLIGDVLTVTRVDVAIIWGGAALAIGVLLSHWTALLTATLNPDLASASGINPSCEYLILTLLLAAVVAVAIKVVGALLITALLIIPAAAARGFARTPEQMAGLAAVLGAISAVGGLRVALMLDTSVGTTIVCLAAALFAIGTVVTKLRSVGV